MNYLLTFTEGLASFISPCTLPLLPVFVAYFAADGRRPFRRALAFILGFSAVFILLGIASAGAGAFLAAHRSAVRIASGAVLILMALVFLEVLPFRLQVAGGNGLPPSSAFLFGVLFAVNLSPCIGAFLAAALVAAANGSSIAEGAALLAAYSLGLALPFLASALILARLNGLFARVKSAYNILVPLCAVALAAYGGWMIHLGTSTPGETAAVPAAAPAPAPELTHGEVIDISSVGQFDSEIAAGTAVVDFWAPWCGPCRRMAPVLHEIAAEYPHVKVLKVNVDDFRGLAQSYGVSGIPAIFRLDDGSVTASAVGARPKADLVSSLNLR